MNCDGQEYLRCRDCGEFVNSSEAEAHKCPKSKTKKRKWMSQRAYVKAEGGVCPACGSDQIEGESVDIEAGGASQGMRCTECGAFWIDCYELTEYVKTGEPDDSERGGTKGAGVCENPNEQLH